MNRPLHPRRSARLTVVAASVSIAATALVGCQERSTTVQTPNGSVTTTTLEPTPEARQQLDAAAAAASAGLSRAGEAASSALAKAREAGADAAAQVRESAASGALARLGDAAKRAGERVGAAASDAADRVRDSAQTGTLSRVGDAARDAAITAQVKAAFLVDKDVKGLQVDVDTHDGVVTLSGAADSQPHLEHAAEIARRIDGVKSVENRMTVKTSG